MLHGEAQVQLHLWIGHGPLCGDGIVIKACKAKVHQVARGAKPSDHSASVPSRGCNKVHQVARGAKTPKPSDHSASVPSRGPWLSEQRVSGERKTKEDQEEKEEMAAEKWTQEDEVRNRLKEYNKNLEDTISTPERLVASSL